MTAVEFHCGQCSRGVRRNETRQQDGITYHTRCGVDVQPWTPDPWTPLMAEGAPARPVSAAERDQVLRQLETLADDILAGRAPGSKENQ